MESILAQTFQNFEVIIVNDCSTDASCEIVESYAEKFGGRLTLMRTKNFSGNAGISRNKGLPLSRGEYVFFMDADDLITKTALEELYTLAKKFGAEVIYTERWYDVPENFSLYGDNQNFALRTTDEKNFKNVPVFESDDLSERIRDAIGGRFHAVCWKKLILRDMLIRNEINFPTNFRIEDFCWTLKVLYHAKKILRVPNPIYFYRHVQGSLSRATDPLNAFYQTLKSLVDGMKVLDEFMRSADFFKTNAEFRYAVSDCYAGARLRELFALTVQTPLPAVYKIISENKETSLGEYNDLISYLVTCVNAQQKINAINAHKFNEFARAANDRIAQLEAELRRLKS